jgi:hypothetical protein
MEDYYPQFGIEDYNAAFLDAKKHVIKYYNKFLEEYLDYIKIIEEGLIIYSGLRYDGSLN